MMRLGDDLDAFPILFMGEQKWWHRGERALKALPSLASASVIGQLMSQGSPGQASHYPVPALEMVTALPGCSRVVWNLHLRIAGQRDARLPSVYNKNSFSNNQS